MTDELRPIARPRSRRFQFAVTRPVAVLVVFLAVAVFGGFSLLGLPLQLMPDIAYPKLTVRAEYDGAAPAEVEDDVARPLEEVLGVVTGVTRIESVSQAGSVDVELEFAWGTDLDDANQDVLEKLDAVAPLLPEEVDAPLILRYDPSLDPVLVLQLSELELAPEADELERTASLRRLRRLAEREVERLLEPVPGVAAVRVEGGLAEEIHVDLHEEALRRTRTGIGDVITRLDAQNVNIAGGNMRDGKMRHLVRTVNEFGEIEQIRNMVVARRDQRDIRLIDLATVTRSHEEATVMTRVDGRPAVRIEVYKEAEANIVTMAKRVEAAVTQKLAPRMQARHGVRLAVVTNRAAFIESTIAEVRNAAVTGGLLAIVILFLFLRSFKATAIVAVAIPISVIISFAPLDVSGVSLNIMSLGGLALGIGMLVDNAIVVLESIYRCSEEGDDLRAATLRGTSEVGLAVVAATSTSVAVFLPMVFVDGVAGQMFGDLGLTVVFSLLASLAVALGLIPMLVSRRAGESAGAEAKLRWHQVQAARWRDFEAWAELRRFMEAPGSRSWRGVWRWPYVLIRTLIHLTLELVGKLLATIFGSTADLLVFCVGWGARILLWLATPVTYSFDRGLKAVTELYRWLLRFSIRRRGLIILMLVAAAYLVSTQARRLDTELIPEMHQGEFTLDMRWPVGTPLEETDLLVAPVEAALIAEVPRLRTMTTTIGSERDAAEESERGEHTARLTLALAAGGGQGSMIERSSADSKARDKSNTNADADDANANANDDAASRAEQAARKAEIAAARAIDTETAEAQALAVVRGLIAQIPDIEVDIVRPVMFSFKSPVELEIRGHDLEELGLVSRAVARRIGQIEGIEDIRVSMRRGQPEIQISYDRDALARYGLEIRRVAELVRDKVRGREATKFNLGDRKVPVRVRLRADDRLGVAELRRMVVNPGGERPITLGAVAQLERGFSPSEIRRVGQRRVAVVTAHLDGIGLASARRSIEAALTQVEVPAGGEVAFAGQAEEWDRSSTSLFFALGLSIFLVYVIMAAQFEHLGHPLIILCSIPLALGGVIAALLVLDLSVSVVVGLGVIMLSGIVVNNAIVLVDYINQLRARGLDLMEAVESAGIARLRPILMTTATTVLGLLPMALGVGDGAEIRQPMAVTVIAGLGTSTLLTLVVIPVLYVSLDRLLGQQVPGRAALELENALQDAGHGTALERGVERD